MFKGWLQYQNTVADIFRLDCRFTGHFSAECFSEQVSDSFNAGGCIDIADHPLHGSCLNGDRRYA